MDNVTRLLMQGAAGAAGGATYVDDVFSTLLWSGEFTGNAGTTRQMTNGIDLAGEGGLVWIKQRNQAYSTGHQLYDTVRGAGAEKELNSSSNAVEGAGNIETYGWLNSFDAGGFTTKGGSTDSDYVNRTGVNYASWTFRKQKGFFDIVEFTGNGTSSQVISHNLGSVPGCIILKAKNAADNWKVYHRGINGGVTPEKWLLGLNDTQAASEYTEWWNDTAPTATNFTVGEWNNESGWDFVAYVFAGGASTAATARSVNFDGSSDYLHTASSSDLAMGTGDFTVEGWIKFKTDPTTHAGFYQISSNSNGLEQTYYGQTIGLGYSGDNWRIYGTGSLNAASDSTITVGDWYHVAHVRSSGVSKLYVNGKEVVSATDTYNYTGTYLAIGSYNRPTFSSNAYISNFRVVKGTAVYTSSFRPPTEPLTNITNTKVLCCNNTSTTGKTVGPTLTVQGTISASTDSPFDDPEGFKFGGDEDQNIIKTGSYIGNGSATGPEVYLGFEPQWLLIKNANGNENWLMFDSMRGIVTGGEEARLFANANTAESSPGNFINLTPTGFKINDNGGDLNDPNDPMIYIAIRRPDPLVGKPALAGTDVFAMDTGSSSSTIPEWDSGFPVDLGLYKTTGSTQNWHLGARLIQVKNLYPNTTDPEVGIADNVFDSNLGWGRSYAGTYGSAYQSWMWKRGAGFDVVTYKGNSTGSYSGDSQVIQHNLGKVPEMIWCKTRDASGYWGVYHKGLNGGTNPANYRLLLNDSHAESAASGSYTNWYWNNTAPTATQFSVGEVSNANANNTQIIAMLFASVDGISKVGSYTGTGASGNSITLGFQPRFLLIKNANNASVNWVVYDTVRGWTGTNDKFLNINQNYAQGTTTIGPPTSTGFTVNATNTSLNSSGDNFVYYAHA